MVVFLGCALLAGLIIILFIQKRGTVTIDGKKIERIDSISLFSSWNPKYDCSLSDISGNGRYVTFTALLNKRKSVFVRDNTDRRVISIDALAFENSQNRDSFFQGRNSISDDGRFVVFTSKIQNKKSPHAKKNVFLYDLKNMRVSVISKGQNNVEANGDSFCPAISGNGRYIYFVSYASNLVETKHVASPLLYKYDVVEDKVYCIKLPPELIRASLNRKDLDAQLAQNLSQWTHQGSIIDSLSEDGRYFAFTAENELMKEVYISGSGSFLSFPFLATVEHNLMDEMYINSIGDFLSVFLYDTKTEEAQCTSSSSLEPADGDSRNPSMSADGRYTAYVSEATNIDSSEVLDAVTEKVYLYDSTSRKSSRVSIQKRSEDADYDFGCDNAHPTVSPDGTFVVYRLRKSHLGSEGHDELRLYDIKMKTTSTAFIFPSSPVLSEGLDIREEPAVVSRDASYLGFGIPRGRTGTLRPFLLQRSIAH
jgi:Tol biopolymer transport system component